MALTFGITRTMETSSLLLKNVDNFSIGVPAAIEISKGLFSIINSLVSFNIFSIIFGLTERTTTSTDRINSSFERQTFAPISFENSVTLSVITSKR